MINQSGATRVITHTESFTGTNYQQVDEQMKNRAHQLSTDILSAAYVNQTGRIIAHVQFTNKKISGAK